MAVSPFLGVDHRGLERELEALPRGVQPPLDGADRDVEQLGDLDQRVSADVESIQGLAIERLELGKRLPEPLGTLAA